MARRKRTEADDAGDALGEEAEKLLGFIMRPVKKLEKNARRAMATPRTTVARLKRDFEASCAEQFSNQSPEDFLRRTLNLFPREVDLPTLTQEAFDDWRATLREDSVGAQLLALSDAADAAGPVSPLLVVVGCQLDEQTVDHFSVYAKFDEASGSRGERRARAFLEAIPDLTENVYARYLRAIWSLSFLAEGQWPPPPSDKLGLLVKQTAQRVQSYPGLVDADAGHLRNAVAHRHAKYVPANRSVEFRDMTWEMTLSLKALEIKLMAMWHVARMLTHELLVGLGQTMFLQSGIFTALPLTLEAMQGDAAAQKALEERNPGAALDARFMRTKPPPGTTLWFLSPPPGDGTHA